MEKRGLDLHPLKTQVRHIDEGFDFLGWNIRKYKGKLLIKPREKSIQQLKETIKAVFNKHISHKQEALIYELNPILRGWANYYRTHVSSCKSRFIGAKYLFLLILMYGHVHKDGSENDTPIKP